MIIIIFFKAEFQHFKKKKFKNVFRCFYRFAVPFFLQ